MAGAPSQLDLFDPKPRLQELHGQPLPDSYLQGERFAFIKGHPKLLGSPHTFAQHGQSGAWFSNLLPHLARQADRLLIARSMRTTQFTGPPNDGLSCRNNTRTRHTPLTRHTRTPPARVA